MSNTSTENDERYENGDYNSDNSIESVDEECSDEEIDGDDTDGGFATWVTRLMQFSSVSVDLNSVDLKMLNQLKREVRPMQYLCIC